MTQTQKEINVAFVRNRKIMVTL